MIEVWLEVKSIHCLSMIVMEKKTRLLKQKYKFLTTQQQSPVFPSQSRKTWKQKTVQLKQSSQPILSSMI